MSRSSKSEDLAGLFAALADTTRLRLLNLMTGREVCVCHFVEILGQSQPKISCHLAYLRSDRQMQSERARLDRALCAPQNLVALKGAPQINMVTATL